MTDSELAVDLGVGDDRGEDALVEAEVLEAFVRPLELADVHEHGARGVDAVGQE